MRFSGAERGAEKAIAWLELKFNEPQLMIPKIFKEIRNIIPARNVGEMPRTAERVLTKVESLSALMKNDEASLPADIVQAIFRSFHLSTEEKKQVLHYLKANVKVSITEIREYILNRFQEYKAMINGSPLKQKFELKPPRPADSLQAQPLRMVVEREQDREDEVRGLDTVAGVGGEEEAGGPTR